MFPYKGCRRGGLKEIRASFALAGLMKMHHQALFKPRPKEQFKREAALGGGEGNLPLFPCSESRGGKAGSAKPARLKKRSLINRVKTGIGKLALAWGGG